MAHKQGRGGKRHGPGWLRRALRGARRRDGSASTEPKTGTAPEDVAVVHDTTEGAGSADKAHASLDQVLRRAAQARATARYGQS